MDLRVRQPAGARDVPVVDLRGQLNLPHGTYGRHPCIIVVESAAPEGPRLAGFIADCVARVVYARGRDLSYGKLQFGGRSLRILDPEALLATSSAPVAPAPAVRGTAAVTP